MSSTVLLVDDHPVFRKGLFMLFEEEEDLQVVGEAEDGQRALEMVRELSPDVVIMDITMPNLDGIQATRGILAESPETRVIALSIHGGKRFVEDMLQAGAAGYVLKDSVPEELVDAVRRSLRGERYLSASITGLVISQYMELLSRVHASGGPGKLSQMEQDFVLLVGEGCSDADIAQRLGVSREEASSIERSVLVKLRLSSVAELSEYAGAQKWFAGQDEAESEVQRAAALGQKRRSPRPQPLIEPLTNRELDVLELLAQRLYDKEIAAELGVGVTTVKTHIGNLFQKLAVRNRREAAAKARELGLLNDS